MAELITRKEGAIGWIVFSNLPKLNAMTLDMWQALPGAFESLEADPKVRVIVLAGDGDKAFISGADISQFEKQRGSAEAQAVYGAAVDHGYTAPARCSKPVIAKIRGVCMGGGMGLSLSCDLRIAAEDALFRMPAARLGLGYDHVALKRFVDVIGPAHAADLFFSARKFSAADALAMGLVNRVVPVADFDRAVHEYAAMIGENAPLTLRAAKRAIQASTMDPAERDIDALKKLIAACFDSEDYKEGRRAFMEKRTPRFTGR